MNDNDTSDEGFEQWASEQKLDDCETYWFWEQRLRDCWCEAVRRCEAQMEERERKAFEAGLDFNPYSDRVCTKEEVENAYRAFKEEKYKTPSD